MPCENRHNLSIRLYFSRLPLQRAREAGGEKIKPDTIADLAVCRPLIVITGSVC